MFYGLYDILSYALVCCWSILFVLLWCIFFSYFGIFLINIYLDCISTSIFTDGSIILLVVITNYIIGLISTISFLVIYQIDWVFIIYFIHVPFFYLFGIYILYFYYFSDFLYISTCVLSLINQCLHPLSRKDLRILNASISYHFHTIV